MMSGLGSGVVKLGVKRRKRVRLNESEGDMERALRQGTKKNHHGCGMGEQRLTV